MFESIGSFYLLVNICSNFDLYFSVFQNQNSSSVLCQYTLRKSRLIRFLSLGAVTQINVSNCVSDFVDISAEVAETKISHTHGSRPI